MASDDVWLAFQPKVSNKICSSNLSQISNFSLGSQSLSLSCRAFKSRSSQVHLETKNTLASSSKSPQMKSSTPRRTPKSSPMLRTPKSSHKNVTPKRNTPQDGLIQKRIDNYFGSETKQIATASIVSDVEIVDLTCDGEEDEGTPKAGREGFSNQSHKTLDKLSNVSRVLFPQTSQTSSEKTKQLGIDCNPSVRGKENLDGNPSQGSKMKNSEKSPEMSVDVFKPPRAFEYKVAKVRNLSKSTNPVKTVSNSSDLAKVVSTSTSNGDDSNQTSVKNVVGNDTSQARKSTGNEDTSSASSEFNGGEYSVELSKGKKNLFKKKNVEVDSTKKICSTKNNTEQAASQTKVAQSRTAHGVESFENFTGVTECVSVQSSGEMWTPRHKLGSISSDSDDFEMELDIKQRKRSPPKKNNFQKVHGKKPEKNTISKAKLSRNKKVRGKSPTDTGKINKKVSTSHPSSPVVEELSGASKKVNKCVQESSERDFTLSGGFFPEEDGNEKLPGQAFVIRSPSQKYHSCWEDLMEDSSITVEREKISSDSEKSSILADLSLLDQEFDASVFSAQTSSTVFPNKGFYGNTMRNSLSKNTIKDPKENNHTLPYHSNLAGVSLSTSQWNDIPNCQKYVNNTMDGNANKIHVKNNCDFIQSKSFLNGLQGNESPALSEGYDKRASSPHEAEVAPKDAGFGVRRNSDAQLLETSPEKAMMDSHLDSQVNSVSSEIGYSPKEIHCSEYSSCDEIPNLERVQEWISKTNDKKLTSESEEGVDEDRSHSKQKLTEHYAISKHYPGTNQKWRRKRFKSCNIKCDVKIFVKSNASINGSVIKNVKRMRCRERNAVQRREKQKSAVDLAVEVQEMTPSEVQKEDEHKRSKKTASHHEKQYSVMDSAGAEILSECNSSKRIPIKVQVKYGKWGWEEFEIECVKEVENGSNDNTNFPALFCVQEVVVNICNCSSHMQIDCIISKETVPRADLICRSRYSTSLKNYLSHWGSGDDPITLSVVAYSKLFNPTLDNSFCSTIPHSEKDTIIISSGQFASQTNIDSHNTSNSSFQMTSDSHSLRSTSKGSKELSQDSESDGQGTPSGLSDDFQEWMTQPLETEPSKDDAASKWKDLMQRMRSGSSTKSSSSSSLSSLSSLTSQGTSADEHVRGRRSYGRERKPKICPFYKIVRGTTFAVDAFSYGTISGVTHYFLSHFHYDHYMGLTKKFAHPIYCSSITARLVGLKIRMDPFLLRRIDPGQTVVVENTKVTALDANHCPGSVMFLFELPNGKTHLHCGDFRAHPFMESYHALWNVDIDQLYLDTTYCDPTYNFPSQQEIINDILIIVEEALKTEPKTLIVCGSYTIGKERVFAAIAEKLKAKIWAPYDKYRVLQCVKEGLQDLSSQNGDGGGAGRELELVQALSLLTKFKEEAQIHVLPMSYLKKKVLEEHLYSIKGIFNKVVAFRPTGWAHGRTKGTNLFLNSPDVKIYDAAYSEHSSFSEMARFVKFIQPKQVVKTVNVGSPGKRQAMEKHINSWLAIAKSKVPIPNKNNESPKSAKVIEEQKKAGFFQARSLSKTKLSSRTQFLHSSSTLESSDYAALSTQTSLSKSQTQESGFFHSASRVAVKRTCSISEGPSKRRLI